MLFGKGRTDKTLEDQPARVDIIEKDNESAPINWTPEERTRLEKKFLRKLDLRMSILVVVGLCNIESSGGNMLTFPIIIGRSIFSITSTGRLPDFNSRLDKKC
jgi:hypothetical protein